MPDDRLADTLRLSERRTEALQFLQSSETALELKRHVRCAAHGRRAGDVVEEAGQGPGFEERGAGFGVGEPGW